MNPRLLRPTASGATHPEARDWATRVTANGGTVTSTTLAAVSKFCAAINAAGIRDRFYRLNLFCGTGLNACLVPLYQGQSLAGAQFGNSTDTNIGPFVSGDYLESNGLDPGDTNTSKALNTGLSPDAMGTADGHLSFYSPFARAFTAGVIVNAMGIVVSTSRYRVYTQNTTNSNPAENCDWGVNLSRSVTAGSFTSGHVNWSQDSVGNTSLCVINGSQALAGTASTTSPQAMANPFFVFGNNNNGAVQLPIAQAFRSYSIGRAMNLSQSQSYYTALQAFQTALGRNV
jgi:hypothetical protein